MRGPLRFAASAPLDDRTEERHVKKLGGLDAFHKAFKGMKSLVVGSNEAPLEAFLRGEIPLF